MHASYILCINVRLCLYVYIRRVRSSSIVSPSLCVCAMPKSKRRSHHKSTRSHKRSRTHDGPRGPRESASESSAESSSCSSAEQRACKLLHRGTVLFCKLPRKRLQDMLKASDERLDSFWSGGLPDEDVHRCLWMLTRITPNMKVSLLQVKTYKEACRKCKAAASRTKVVMGEQRFEMMVASIL